MMHRYGNFPDSQFNQYKKKLHKDLFWLLLYKDPKTSEQFQNVNFDKYFVGLMRKIDGLNDLLMNPVELIEIMSLLQAAYKETSYEFFDFSVYRKLILDAHSLVDKIFESDGDDDDNS